MSDLETQVRPERDYSALGIDADVAELIVADLAPDNPSRYENAGIWGGLIVEQAARIGQETGLDGVYREEFLSYVNSSLLEADEETAVATSFAVILGYDEIVERVRLPSDREYGTDEGISWKGSPQRIEAFVAESFEREALIGKRREFDKQLEAQIHDISSEKLEAHIADVTTVDERLEELDLGRRPAFNFFAGNGERKDEEAKRKLEFLQKFEPILAEVEPNPDDHARYGAKAANLIQLDGVLAKMKQADIGVAEYLSIPDFRPIGVEVYKAWLAGESIDEQVNAIAAWASLNQSARYMVRSSAVFSEDGEHTGAGIYDSTFIDDASDPESVLEAIEKVYESVNSDEAIAYRKSIGIDHEEMGLIMQQVANSGYLDDTVLGTISTVMAAVPKLMDYSITSGSHELYHRVEVVPYRQPLPLDRKGALRQFGVMPLFDPYPYEPRFHVPPDIYQHHLMDSWMATQAAIIAEKVMGRPVQLEFSADSQEDHLYILQSRPLPVNTLREEPFIGFPEDRDPVYIGKSVGVVDGQRAIVSRRLFDMQWKLEKAHKSNPDRKLLLIATDSFGMGSSRNRIIEEMSELSHEQRQKIMVLIEEAPSRGSGYGHLETLFTELGVPLICNKFGDGSWPELESDQLVTIYSNGYEGRIYSDSDNTQS